MGTEILKSFGSLQSELEQARNSLKGVDENIKRLIGRDPSELPLRQGQKRIVPFDEKGRHLKIVNRNRNGPFENEEPPNKRRNNVSVFKRLSERCVQDDDIHHGIQKQMISKVIVTPKEIPSREEALEAQNKDEKFKARNKRMFGALLGTLQKFQQEETKLKSREDKRAQLERKIEEHEIKEKEEIKKERQELFFNRKKKQTEIKIIELKMMRMKEYAAWEVSQKPRSNFIWTKTEPRIHFLPRRLNDKAKELLEASKIEVEATIEKKRLAVFDELKHIEDRMKRNMDAKFGSKEAKSKIGKQESVQPDDTEEKVDHFDHASTELPPNEESENINVDETSAEVAISELNVNNDRGDENKEENHSDHCEKENDKKEIQVDTEIDTVIDCPNDEKSTKNEEPNIV